MTPIHRKSVPDPGWDQQLEPVLGRIAGLATGRASLRVMHAGSRFAFGLPADRRAARMVIGLYQPQRWKGRAFKNLAKGLCWSGVAARFPNFPGGIDEPEVKWLGPAATAGAVGFLGCNPVHGWRCVLAGIDPVDESPFVAKLGLGESAGSIRREGKVLESLKGRYPGVIAARSLDTADHRVDGEHDWALLRLPYLGSEGISSIRDGGVAELLLGWLTEDRLKLGEDPWTVSLLERLSEDEVPNGWLGRIRDKEIRRALVHGDFAVWNLRLHHGALAALDWEWAEEQAIGGIDLAHALRQEAVMVRGLGATEAIDWMLGAVQGSHWETYLRTAGWGDDRKDWLRLGLLHSHFHTKNESSGLLGALGIKVSSYA